jgi:lipid-binding SYLF domain-containing protein
MIRFTITRISLFICTLIAAVSVYPTSSLPSNAAQKPDPKKFQDAINRSADAGRILTLLAVTPDNGIPKELLDRSEAIAVFPKVVREMAVFTQTTKGYGVISSRTEKGWTMPAFYRFGGGGYTNPFSNGESYALILLFLTKDSLKWFEKGGVVLADEREAIEGPVGTLSDDQRRSLLAQPMLAYAYYNGKLTGKGFSTTFWRAFALNPDNNINRPVYGVKGREVLAGANLDAAKVLEGISAYQEALIKHYTLIR